MFFSFGAWSESEGPYSHDPFWHGFNEGCIGRNIIKDVMWMDFPLELPSSSFAFGYKPDTGNGTAFMTGLDPGDLWSPPEEREERIFLATSLKNRSCIIKTNFKKCPEARQVYNMLKKLMIPAASKFYTSSKFTLMHSTDYFLHLRNSQSLENRWNERSGDSPVTNFVEKASELLRECSESAFTQVLLKDNHK